MNEDNLLNESYATTPSAVDYSEYLENINSNIVSLDADVLKTNELLEHAVFGLDVLVFILIVFIVSNFVFKFFSRGFR